MSRRARVSRSLFFTEGADAVAFAALRCVAFASRASARPGSAKPTLRPSASPRRTTSLVRCACHELPSEYACDQSEPETACAVALALASNGGSVCVPHPSHGSHGHAGLPEPVSTMAETRCGGVPTQRYARWMYAPSTSSLPAASTRGCCPSRRRAPGRARRARSTRTSSDAAAR